MKLYFFFAALVVSSGTVQSQQPVAQTNPAYSQQSAAESASNLDTQIQQLNGAIKILERGVRENWPLERYFTNFDESPTLRSRSDLPQGSLRQVQQALIPLKRPRTIWDERPPVNVEIIQVLNRLRGELSLLQNNAKIAEELKRSH
jgi:hypothetical protein